MIRPTITALLATCLLVNAGCIGGDPHQIAQEALDRLVEDVNVDGAMASMELTYSIVGGNDFPIHMELAARQEMFHPDGLRASFEVITAKFGDDDGTSEFEDMEMYILCTPSEYRLVMRNFPNVDDIDHTVANRSGTCLQDSAQESGQWLEMLEPMGVELVEMFSSMLGPDLVPGDQATVVEARREGGLIHATYEVDVDGYPLSMSGTIEGQRLQRLVMGFDEEGMRLEMDFRFHYGSRSLL